MTSQGRDDMVMDVGPTVWTFIVKELSFGNPSLNISKHILKSSFDPILSPCLAFFGPIMFFLFWKRTSVYIAYRDVSATQGSANLGIQHVFG